MNFITENKEWIFSGIGAAIILYVLQLLTKRKKSGIDIPSIPTSNSASNTNTVYIYQGPNSQDQEKFLSPTFSQQQKQFIKILFIDDDRKFKVVDILRKSGWLNTKSKKDILNLEDIDAREANVIFVDINGVGTRLFQDQGLGLAVALKNKYPDKKIVIYSAESNGDRFHRAFKIVDDFLSKNAEPYEFINLLETFESQLIGR